MALLWLRVPVPACRAPRSAAAQPSPVRDGSTSSSSAAPCAWSKRSLAKMGCAPSTAVAQESRAMDGSGQLLNIGVGSTTESCSAGDADTHDDSECAQGNGDEAAGGGAAVLSMSLASIGEQQLRVRFDMQQIESSSDHYIALEIEEGIGAYEYVEAGLTGGEVTIDISGMDLDASTGLPVRNGLADVTARVRYYAGERVIGEAPLLYERVAAPTQEGSGTEPNTDTRREVIVYGNKRCGWCTFVKDELASAGIEFHFADVDDGETSSEMWAKAEEAGLGLDGTIGLPIVDVGGVIRMRPSSDDVWALLRAPSPVQSSSIRKFRSAVNRLHAVNRVTLAPRAFLPAILPGVSSPEDEEELRAMMSQMDGFDNAIRNDLENAQQAVDQEIAQQAQSRQAQLARRTEKAVKKLHGNQGVPAVSVAAATVGAIVRWTNRAVIAHDTAVAEATAAAAATVKSEGEVVLYGRDTCGWCSHVAADFTSNGIQFRKVDIDDDAGSAEMWRKVRTNPEIGSCIGLPVVDICGSIRMRPTAEEALAIIRNPPATNAAGNTGRETDCVGENCTIISHEDGSREGGKPALLSLDAALALPPVSSFYGMDGPQDERLTVYGLFASMSCKLHCPTRGPLVTGVPFQLCLVAGTDVEEVGVLADGEFPLVACLKPKKVQNGMNVFFGEILITAEADALTFYSVSVHQHY